MVQQKVVTLLSDSENVVKQSLMENGITRLCVFFGRQKANDVLLSHMITFLNDKNDWHLRGAFFDSIVGENQIPFVSTPNANPKVHIFEGEKFIVIASCVFLLHWSQYIYMHFKTNSMS